MNKYYKVSQIREALDYYEKSTHTGEWMSLPQLEQIIKKLKSPEIYNIEELIRLLSTYINENQQLLIQLYKESEVCKILKVQKLTMHQWRKNGNITYLQVDTRSIRYNLQKLLEDLKRNIR
jgi:hypothetical protein